MFRTDGARWNRIGGANLDRRSAFMRKVDELKLAGQMNRHAPQCLGSLEDDEMIEEFRDFIFATRLEWENGS